MKRILIALAVLLAVQVADAQVKTPEAAKKAVESAKAAAENPKKATRSLLGQSLQIHIWMHIMHLLEMHGLVQQSRNLHSLWVMRSLYRLKTLSLADSRL